MLKKRLLFILCLAAIVIITGCSQPNYKPSDPDTPLNLENLNGMYAGFRDDFGGSECGGMCWDFYTFLPKNNVFIGLPDNGGPETIDCKENECLTYKISDGMLKLSDGESVPIEITDEQLVINKIKLNPVIPVPKGTTLDNTYTYIGYFGLIGVNGAASSWTYKLILESNGTFELSGVTLGSLGATSGGPSTHASSSDSNTIGTYQIQNNTIMMKSDDGKEENALFFIHNGDEEDIQIGDKNYYVKKN